MEVTENDDSPWWKKGLPFQCQQSGKCCHARGEYSWVYVNWRERQKIAKSLGLSLEEFNRRHTLSDHRGNRILRFENGHCTFLKDQACQIHEVKPVQCKTWPFWEELLETEEIYRREVMSFCPGSKQGKLVPGPEIARQLQESKEAVLEEE